MASFGPDVAALQPGLLLVLSIQLPDSVACMALDACLSTLEDYLVRQLHLEPHPRLR
jgi:hypothetical protein